MLAGEMNIFPHHDQTPTFNIIIIFWNFFWIWIVWFFLLLLLFFVFFGLHT